MRRRAWVIAACSLVGFAFGAIAEEVPGSFGFTVEVDGEGFFLNPTLKSLTVTAVAASSPAAKAGVAPKDQIVEAEGRSVVGAKAKDLESLLKKQAGQSLRLRLRRPNGEEYSVTLVAVPKAAAP
jgi:C-terminal processing protease CtpA/Prc